MKNHTYHLLILATLLLFGTKLSFTQESLYIVNDHKGEVTFSAKKTEAGSLHFYIFGSGYYTNSSSPTHQFNASNYKDSTILYLSKPYRPNKPKRFAIAPSGGKPKWFGASTNPKAALPLDIEVKESWSPASHTGNEHFYILVFENKNNEMADGCVEFHYNSGDLDIDPSDVLIYNDWVYNQTIGLSTETGCNTKISWDFDTLKHGIQRMVYIPTSVTAATGSTITRVGKYFNACTGAGSSSSSTSSTVQLYPHDPNLKQADKACILPGIPDMQSIEYYIQFQNDGEYFAQDVLVFDYIPPEFELNTFTFLDSKYPCTVSVDTGTRRVDFFFDEIWLPGSDQDVGGITYSYEETVGWLKFRICTLPYIPPNHCIKNEAGIIFDTQPIFYARSSRLCGRANESCGFTPCF